MYIGHNFYSSFTEHIVFDFKQFMHYALTLYCFPRHIIYYNKVTLNLTWSARIITRVEKGGRMRKDPSRLTTAPRCQATGRRLIIINRYPVYLIRWVKVDTDV